MRFTNTYGDGNCIIYGNFIAGDIHVKTQEASQNTDLDMQWFLENDKALQTMQEKQVNHT